MRSLLALRLIRRSCPREFNIPRTASTDSTRNVDGGSDHADKSSGDGSSRDKTPTSYRAWELHSYSSKDQNGSDWPDLQLATKSRIPVLKTPTDVRVRVYAASINPIDVQMVKGYGHTMINFLRGFESSTKNWTTLPSDLKPLLAPNERIEFPLILGRDFSGVVSQVGLDVKDMRIGDEVYGFCGVQNNGSHSDFVVTPRQMVHRKPKNLDFVEAASLPYVGLTSWSAIRITGGFQNLVNKKFLVLGGSGGVGSYAIQYLKAHGSYVASTCSTDAIPMVESFGTDSTIDYNLPEHIQIIKQSAPYDCILDLTGPTKKQSELIQFLKPGVGQYITLSPPFLSNIDKFGLCGGFVRNLNDIVMENFNSLRTKQVPSKWSFFIPLGCALESLTTLVEGGKIVPAIQEVFSFDRLPDAYKRLEAGHARGKIVVDFQSESEW